jgi:hypothetical protein
LVVKNLLSEQQAAALVREAQHSRSERVLSDGESRWASS